MSKRNLIICIIAIVMIVIVVCLINIKNKKAKNNQVSQPRVEYKENESTGTYTVYDEGGNVRVKTDSEIVLKKYLDNPDYDPSFAPPGSDQGYDKPPIEE